MALEQELAQFWEAEIRPRFSQAALEAQRESKNGSRLRYVNLDNAATTKPFCAVVERVQRDLDEYGSVHRGAGQDSKITTQKYEAAREAVAQFVGASPRNYVIFTKNTTDAINHAAALWSGIEGKVLVSDVEHSSNLLPWLKEEVVYDKLGLLVKHNLRSFKTRDDGTIDPEAIKSIFDDEKAWKEDYEGRYKEIFTNGIKLLTTNASSNVTGYRGAIYDLAELAHRHGAKILVDACQLVPHQKMHVFPDDDPRHIDFVAFSGHKMYAPFGAGVLIGPKDFFDAHMPYQIGGGNIGYITSRGGVIKMERVQTHEPGTPNFIGAVAIAEAIRVLEDIGMEMIGDYEYKLVGLALDGLRANTSVQTYAAEPHGSVIPFDIDGFPAQLVSEILAMEFGIGTRAGAFCTYELIRKLKGVTPDEDAGIAEEVGRGITAQIPSVARASFSIYNRPEDVTRFVAAVDVITRNRFDYYKEHYFMDCRTGVWHPKTH